MIQQPRSLAVLVLALAAGWLMGRALLSSLRDLTIGPFALLPGLLIAILAVLLLSAKLAGSGRKDATIAFCLGALADALPWWIVRPGTQSPFDVTGPWSRPVVLGSGIALGASLSLLVIARLLNTRHAPPAPSQPLINHGAAALGLAIMMLVHRGGYLLTKHLPNEERSIMIADTELHHAALGGGLLVALGVLVLAFPGRRPALGMLGVGAVAAMILDQITYIPLVTITDAAYGSPRSWAGAGIAALGYLLFLLGHFSSHRWLDRSRPRAEPPSPPGQ